MPDNNQCPYLKCNNETSCKPCSMKTTRRIDEVTLGIPNTESARKSNMITVSKSPRSAPSSSSKDYVSKSLSSATTEQLCSASTLARRKRFRPATGNCYEIGPYGPDEVDVYYYGDFFQRDEEDIDYYGDLFPHPEWDPNNVRSLVGTNSVNLRLHVIAKFSLST